MNVRYIWIKHSKENNILFLFTYELCIKYIYEDNNVAVIFRSLWSILTPLSSFDSLWSSLHLTLVFVD